MKALLILFPLLAAVCNGQTYPIIGGLTVTPSEPTEDDEVVIVTSVETAGQGHRVSQSQNVSVSEYSLGLRACFFSGPATAIQTHLDTFYVGKLQHGYYAVSFKARLSSAPGYCAPSDSTEEATYLQVEPATLSARWQTVSTSLVWPNPCGNELNIRGVDSGSCRVISITGELVGTRTITRGVVTGLSDLAPGIYFLEIDTGSRHARCRFARN